VRVLYWTQLFWPYIGGVEVLAAEFLPAMRSRGYEFAVVASHGALDLPDEGEYRGIPIHRFPFQTALTGRNVDQLMTALHGIARLKRALKPDLIHINLSDPSIFFHVHSSAVHPAPVLVTLSVALPNRQAAAEPDTLLRETFRGAAWINANSAAILADARRLAPEIVHRSSVIYNGLRTPDVPPAPLSFRPPVFLCLGRLVNDKGFDVALKAFATVVKHVPQARLRIVGDGPARPALEQQAFEFGLTGGVEFTGWVAPERVPELINDATVVVVPSRWQEAFSLVALQAAQMARPVVGTRVGGLPEVILHGHTGLLVDNEDSHALAEALVHLLDCPHEAVHMGLAGRHRAHALFSWERHINAYDQLYRRLVSAPDQGGDDVRSTHSAATK
jgi:glycogen synthase